MINNIKKMIAEYDEKINDEAIRLTSVYDKISAMKKHRDCSFDRLAIFDMIDLKNESKIIQARRQAYVQAKSDFDSLLDYV